MDKYTKILVIIVLLIYLNAIALYFFNHNNSGLDIPSSISKFIGGSDRKQNTQRSPDSVTLSFDSGEVKEVKKTKEGHTIKEEFGTGKIQVANFTFDQEGSRIKTVLMSFKTMKIQPKPFCEEVEIKENMTFEVPKMTGMAVKKIQEDALSNMPNTGFSPVVLVKEEKGGIVDKYSGDVFKSDEDNSNQEITFEEVTEEVSYFVTKCQTAEDVYLASVFGTVDIMKNNEALSTYSLTFRKEERGDKLYDYLTVEKDIILPYESGKYGLKVVIWDKISTQRVEHYEEFYVK